MEPNYRIHKKESKHLILRFHTSLNISLESYKIRIYKIKENKYFMCKMGYKILS